MSTIEHGLHLNKPESIGRIAVATAVGLFGATVVADAIRGYIDGSDGANPAAAREITQEGEMPSQRPLSEYLAATLTPTPAPTREVPCTPTPRPLETATPTATSAATVAEAKPETATAAPAEALKLPDPKVINPGELDQFFTRANSSNEVIVASEQQKKSPFPLEFTHPETVKFEKGTMGNGYAYKISFDGSLIFHTPNGGKIISSAEYTSIDPNKLIDPVVVLTTPEDLSKLPNDISPAFYSMEPHPDDNRPEVTRREIRITIPRSVNYQTLMSSDERASKYDPVLKVEKGYILLRIIEYTAKASSNIAKLEEFANLQGKVLYLASQQ